MKPINKYDECEEFWARNRSTGEGTETAKEKLRRLTNCSKPDVNIDDIDSMVSNNEISLESFYDPDHDIEEIPSLTTNNKLTKKCIYFKREKEKAYSCGTK
ncbi:hypothetical protein Droror1_Dr00019052 [Drosera rotundifolia]